MYFVFMKISFHIVKRCGVVTKMFPTSLSFSFQKRSVKKMHLLNDRGTKGLGIQITGGRDAVEEGNNHGIFVTHIMDEGAAAR